VSQTTGPSAGPQLGSHERAQGGTAGANDSLYAYEADSGDLVWRAPIGETIAGSSPTIARGVVYFGSDDSNVYALEAATGDVLWTWGTGGDMNDAPAVADGRVYIGTMFDGFLYAFHLPGTA
jgi:outer membrane protein assembly factor BamB